LPEAPANLSFIKGTTKEKLLIAARSKILPEVDPRLMVWVDRKEPDRFPQAQLLLV